MGLFRATAAQTQKSLHKASVRAEIVGICFKRQIPLCRDSNIPYFCQLENCWSFLTYIKPNYCSAIRQSKRHGKEKAHLS